MRRLVIDYARRKRARRRGAEFEITLTGGEGAAVAGMDADDLAHLGDALDELAKASPELAELVDLHFFCGFSLDEITELRGSPSAPRNATGARLGWCSINCWAYADPPGA